MAQASTGRPEFEFNGYVRLTRTGTAYLLFTLVIGFAALNTGNNALYIGLTFMLGCLLLSGIASKSGLRHLSVEVIDLHEAWAGKATQAKLRIANRSRIWNVRDVIVTSSDLSEPVFVPLVLGRKEVVVPAPFVFQKRGRVELKTVDLYTRYPFGFFLKKRRVRVDSEVVVFPRLLEASAVSDRFRAFTGDSNSANRPGPGSEIHSFRDYSRGDSLRQVYWRKSASAGRWIVKQTDLESSRAVHVVVDPYRPAYATDEQFETMISAAATFIDDTLSRGADLLLTLPRSSVRVQQGQSAMPLFRALALVDPIYEPVYEPVDRNTVVFALERMHEPQSA
jgi:uncharacterized protein (DUF58 family)